MKIEKIDENNQRYIIKLANEKNKSFLMKYDGADFYWTMLDYDNYNEFIITKEDSFLFFQMQQLFRNIQKYDKSFDKVLIDNTFTWISEDYGIYENANKLIITFKNNAFFIKFYQNPNQKFNIKDMCPICFCLNGSKNQMIASAFSLMFLEYQNYHNIIEKNLVKE